VSALHPSMVKSLADDRIAGELENAGHRHLRRSRDVSAPPVTGVPAIVPGEPSHGQALRAFLRHLSPQSSYRRFVTAARPEDVVDVDVMLAADPCHRASVAVLGDVVVGHAHAVAAPDADRVELGVVVADEWQGRGIGTRLVEALLQVEPAASAAELEFLVLAANMPARRLIRRMWPEATGTAEGELVHLRVAHRRAAAVAGSVVRVGCHA
jgi:GNAT superfamily N-acetyltransferase